MFDYFDSMREEFGADSSAFSDYDRKIMAGAAYHNKKLKSKNMKRDLLILLAVWAFGLAAGAFGTVAIIPPKVTHEIYLYKPKVRGNDRVEFQLWQLESDTIEERSVLRKLFHRKGGKQ